MLFFSLPEYEALRSACHQRSADKLLKLACDNGGVFVKASTSMHDVKMVEICTLLHLLHAASPTGLSKKRSQVT